MTDQSADEREIQQFFHWRMGLRFAVQSLMFGIMVHAMVTVNITHQVGNELKPNLSVHNRQYGGIKVDHFRVEKR